MLHWDSMTEIKLPLVPVRDVVIFPYAQVPISLKREKSVRALEASLLGSKRIFIVMQKDKELDDPKDTDLIKVVTIARVNHVQRLPDGVINIVVEGETRAKIKSFTTNEIYFEVN